MNTLVCEICGSRAGIICTDCEDACFCEGSCRAKGERIHNLVCTELEKWGYATPRPDEQSYIAISLPVDGTGPEFYWSKGRYKVQTNETTRVVEKIDLLSVNGDEVMSGNVEITHNLATKKKLPHPFTFSMRDRRGIDGSTVNLSILEMTRGDQRGLWAGPAVLHRNKEHISLSDLTYFATFLDTFKDEAGLLKHALRVDGLRDVEMTRPGIFNEVKESARSRKEMARARKEMARVEKEARDLAAAAEAAADAAWESGYRDYDDDGEDSDATIEDEGK